MSREKRGKNRSEQEEYKKCWNKSLIPKVRELTSHNEFPSIPFNSATFCRRSTPHNLGKCTMMLAEHVFRAYIRRGKDTYLCHTIDRSAITSTRITSNNVHIRVTRVYLAPWACTLLLIITR